MAREHLVSAAAIEGYLRSRSCWVRWREWASGRRYRVARFADRPAPLVVLAHSFRDHTVAFEIALAVEQEWAEVPAPCRESYDEILLKTPGLVVVQLRRKNVCG